MSSNEKQKSSEVKSEECPELISDNSSDSENYETMSESSDTSDEDVAHGTDEVKKFLTAKKTYISGDVIQDNCLPITKTIVGMFKNFCHNCMKNPPKPKNCSKCHQTSYCDKICQKNDWKYHKNECKVFCHKNFRPKECLSTEKLLLRLWLTIESDPTFVTEKHKLLDGSEMCINDVEINTKLLSEDMNRMSEFLQICSHFERYGLKFDREELLRYYGFVTFNSLYHSLFHYDSGLTRSCVGIGMFLETNNIRHSCAPNAAYVNSGFGLQIRAMKAIEPNEEITMSYMDLAKDKKERLKTMKSFYFIMDCKCEKCEQNLDSDIDYKRFSTDLSQIYSISNFGEIMGDSYLSTVDTKQAFEMFSRMIGLYSRIYGQYHPNVTGFLLQQLLAMWRLSKCKTNRNKVSNKEVLKELYAICEANLKITYGTDHYFYNLFRKFKMF